MYSNLGEHTMIYRIRVVMKLKVTAEITSVTSIITSPVAIITSITTITTVSKSTAYCLSQHDPTK